MTASRNSVVDLRKRRLGAHRPAQRELPLDTGSPRRKRVSLRARRIRHRLWMAAFVACSILVLVAVASYLSYRPQFNVASIEVKGTQRVSPAEVASYANSLIHAGGRALFSKSNIFLYHPTDIAVALVAHFPAIKTAKVDRSSLFANVVTITIEERSPFALWCSGEDTIAASDSGSASTTSETVVAGPLQKAQTCYEMDKNGFVFDTQQSGDKLESSYAFAGGLVAASGTGATIGSTFAPGHFDGILAFLGFLQNDGYAPQGASVVSDSDFTVPLAAGFYLKASFGENAEDLAKNLQLILSSDELKDKQDELEYVDLRFGDRVYYKLKTSL